MVATNLVVVGETILANAEVDQRMTEMVASSSDRRCSLRAFCGVSARCLAGRVANRFSNWQRCIQAHIAEAEQNRVRSNSSCLGIRRIGGAQTRVEHVVEHGGIWIHSPQDDSVRSMMTGKTPRPT